MDTSRMVIYLALLAYMLVMAFGLVRFHAMTGLALFVLILSPVLFMWYWKHLKVRHISWLTLGVTSMALLVGTIAYINGIWYELSTGDWRLFGEVPPEAFLAAFAHMLFYVTCYEFFFDDAKTEPTIHYKQAYLMLVMGLVTAALGYLYLFSHIIISFAYSWLIFGLMCAIGYGTLLLARNRLHLLQRLGLFSLAILPFSLIWEWVALHNNLRFFANPHEYIGYITVLEQVVPYEELLFIICVPVVVTLFYELFFDDAA